MATAPAFPAAPAVMVAQPARSPMQPAKTRLPYESMTKWLIALEPAATYSAPAGTVALQPARSPVQPADTSPPTPADAARTTRSHASAIPAPADPARPALGAR